MKHLNAEYVYQKLAEKKELDLDCLGFGVEKHKYELFPPINEDKLRKLENKFKVSLPEDYRAFLLNVGNGGAGPGYGLFSLEGALEGKDKMYDGFRDIGVRSNIVKDFIRPDEIKDVMCSETGMFVLCQHGCANDDYLIVNGNDRGTVWEYIEWVGDLVPLLKEMPDLSLINNLPEYERPEAEQQWIKELMVADREQQMSFTDWYTDWLETPPYISPVIKRRHEVRKRHSRWYKKEIKKKWWMIWR